MASCRRYVPLAYGAPQPPVAGRRLTRPGVASDRCVATGGASAARATIGIARNCDPRRGAEQPSVSPTKNKNGFHASLDVMSAAIGCALWPGRRCARNNSGSIPLTARRKTDLVCYAMGDTSVFSSRKQFRRCCTHTRRGSGQGLWAARPGTSSIWPSRSTRETAPAPRSETSRPPGRPPAVACNSTAQGTPPPAPAEIRPSQPTRRQVGGRLLGRVSGGGDWGVWVAAGRPIESVAGEEVFRWERERS